jgi:hypothetical protein
VGLGRVLPGPGMINAGDMWFKSDSDDGKRIFFQRRGRHVHFFLLFPNDTSAPCLGAAHSVTSLTSKKSLS